MNVDTVKASAPSPPGIDDEVEDRALPSQPITPANVHGLPPDALSDYDSDSDPEPLRYGALPVARFPIGDPNFPPVNGEEYLRRVRAESRSLPSVIATSSDLANNNWAGQDEVDIGTDREFEFDPRPTKRMRIGTPSSSSSSSTAPDSVSFPFSTTKARVDRTWAHTVLRDFDGLQSRLVARRQTLIPVGPAGIPMSVNVQQAARDLLPAEIEQQVPTDLSEEGWRAFLYPETFAPVASEGGLTEEANDQERGYGDAADSLGRDAICRPIFLLSLTQRKLLALIRYHTAWIDTSIPRPTLIDMAQVAFALLVGVDGDVLGMDGAGNVRELGKQCAHVMAHVQQVLDQSAQDLDEDGEEGAVGDDEQEQEWAQGKEVCLALRIVLVVVSQKFGQKDLCALVD